MGHLGIQTPGSSDEKGQLISSRSLVDPANLEQVDEFLGFSENEVREGKSNIVISFEDKESGRVDTKVWNDYDVAKSLLGKSFEDDSTERVAGIAFFDVDKTATFDLDAAKSALGFEISRIRDSLPNLTIQGIFGSQFASKLDGEIN